MNIDFSNNTKAVVESMFRELGCPDRILPDIDLGVCFYYFNGEGYLVVSVFGDGSITLLVKAKRAVPKAYDLLEDMPNAQDILSTAQQTLVETSW